MIKKILLGTVAVIGLISLGGAAFLYSLVNQEVDEYFAGTCTDVPLPGSGEDTQIDRERGLAFVSVIDRMAIAQGEPADPGMIMRIDLNQDPLAAVPALTGGPELRPHGVSIFIDSNGRRHLFVINHPADRSSGDERIELYLESTPGLYVHEETFASPLITRANDMVAVGPRSFYVAQDVDRTSGETLTQLVYFDGASYTSVADDIQSGGGINVSADLQTLYIAETGGESIRVAELNADGTIADARSISLGTAPDNIDIAADGSLWVGAHSNTAALAMHFIVGAQAPSQILRLDLTGTEPVIEEIYMDAGDEISAGSGGTTYEGRLFIGSITARKLLACTMDT